MVRIMGVNLPDGKRIEYGLTFIYGLGFSASRKVLSATKIALNKKIKDLSDQEINEIQRYIEKNFKVEGNLKSEISENIKRLKEISSYRGYRHIRGLPVKGQRTRSNARTRRGRKRTIGSLTKEAWAKLDQVHQQKQVK